VGLTAVADDDWYAIEEGKDSITVEPNVGAKVESCVRKALRLSAERGKPVLMEINTIMLRIDAQPVVDATMNTYRAGIWKGWDDHNRPGPRRGRIRRR
jgi:hypothetical protein